jgi:hypothetical protein
VRKKPDSATADVWSLQLKLRSLERQLEEMRSGKAYERLEESRKKLIREYEAKVKALRRELDARDRQYSRQLQEWFEIFADAERGIRKECELEVRRAKREAKGQEDRALRAERRVDELLDRVRDMARQMRGLVMEKLDLEAKLAKLVALIGKDFTNSSIPSSQQGPGRKPVPNSRERTDRRPGAQPGHPHHPRKAPSPTSPPVMVGVPDGWEDDPDLYFTGEFLRKFLVSARVVVTVTEYLAPVWRRRSNGARVHPEFPLGLRDDVTYDESCKALAFMLNHGCDVSVGRTRDFLLEASGGALHMSDGMIWNLGRQFAARSAGDREELFLRLASAPVMHADFTNARVGGKDAQVFIAAGRDGTCMLFAREHKGHKGIAGTPLEVYVGCVIHDHDVTFYGYGSKHQECLQHILRYLQGSMDNEPELTWAKAMRDLHREMIAAVKALGEGECLDEDVVAGFERRYDEILDLADREYEEHPPTQYYRDGYNLAKRMRAFREAELLFLHEDVPYENSMAERVARKFKRKQHQVMTFRSMEGLEIACVAKTAIENMRTRGEDVFEGLAKVFARTAPATA